jgi:transglutaminase-like putative cysteine protease
VFDARHNMPRCGRVLIGRGRDAADVPFLRSFGEHHLEVMEVITGPVEQTPSTVGTVTQGPAESP